MKSGIKVAVVGATGAVGQELLKLIGERGWRLSETRLLTSQRSEGVPLQTPNGIVQCEKIGPSSFTGIDIALFSAGSDVGLAHAPRAVDCGALVVDNSSAFRMRPDVPLVVPEINIAAVRPGQTLVANPNCSAIIMLMAVAPLRALGKVRRIIVSTYQSASGGGAAMMRDLEDQTRSVLEGKEARPSVTPHPYAFNLFSHNTPIGDDGFCGEEHKMVEETKKILEDPEIEVCPTCVRVPVLRAHSESIYLEFEDVAPSEDDARQALAATPGVKVVDDRESNHFPMPLEATGRDDVLVGRIRRDPGNERALCLFASGDQLRKGAALNAVQIAESLRPCR